MLAGPKGRKRPEGPPTRSRARRAHRLLVHHITISERRLRVLCTLEHTLSVPPWLLAMSLVVPQMVLFHFPNDFPQPCATLFVSQPVCSRPLHACNCSWIFISFFKRFEQFHDTALRGDLRDILSNMCNTQYSTYVYIGLYVCGRQLLPLPVGHIKILLWGTWVWGDAPNKCLL